VRFVFKYPIVLLLAFATHLQAQNSSSTVTVGPVNGVGGSNPCSDSQSGDPATSSVACSALGISAQAQGSASYAHVSGLSGFSGVSSDPTSVFQALSQSNVTDVLTLSGATPVSVLFKLAIQNGTTVGSYADNTGGNIGNIDDEWVVALNTTDGTHATTGLVDADRIDGNSGTQSSTSVTNGTYSAAPIFNGFVVPYFGSPLNFDFFMGVSSMVSGASGVGDFPAGTAVSGLAMIDGRITGIEFLDADNVNISDQVNSSFQSGYAYNIVMPNVTTTPEPSTFVLLGSGLLGLVPVVRRRNK